MNENYTRVPKAEDIRIRYYKVSKLHNILYNHLTKKSSIRNYNSIFCFESKEKLQKLHVLAAPILHL